MSLNPHHLIDEAGDEKFAVVEKNCTPARVEFLKSLLEHNRHTVTVIKSPPPKTAPKPAAEGEPAPAPAPETYTVGTTDLSFNPVNAIYNRELKRHDGRVVTPAYWKQQVKEEKEEEWYWRS